MTTTKIKVITKIKLTDYFCEQILCNIFEKHLFEEFVNNNEKPRREEWEDCAFVWLTPEDKARRGYLTLIHYRVSYHEGEHRYEFDGYTHSAKPDGPTEDETTQLENMTNIHPLSEFIKSQVTMTSKASIYALQKLAPAHQKTITADVLLYPDSKSYTEVKFRTFHQGGQVIYGDDVYVLARNVAPAPAKV